MGKYKLSLLKYKNTKTEVVEFLDVENVGIWSKY